MDIFRRTLDKLCGKGGVHCYCCNPSKGRSRFSKKIYRRIARHRLKRSNIYETN
jgi:hypothetical protein